MDIPSARAAEACKREEGDGTFWIVSDKSDYPAIHVETLHLSCSSDVYQPGHNYAGFILYSHNGQTDWRLNGVHCKTGYIVILDTDSEKVRHWKELSPGQVHGAVYKCIFGEDPAPDTIGEGFAFLGGEFRWNSWTFNGADTVYHDGRREISDMAGKYVQYVLTMWEREGSSVNCLYPARTIPYVICTLQLYDHSSAGICSCALNPNL